MKSFFGYFDNEVTILKDAEVLQNSAVFRIRGVLWLIPEPAGVDMEYTPSMSKNVIYAYTWFSSGKNVGVL